ncbi:hypothetical protein FO519_004521 [Halicephalobus sp. NKZ332]|nr:hypothetical protein FO519_004521 [Halicephalobus sp. NKZ332]
MTDPNRATGNEADIDSGPGSSTRTSIQPGFVVPPATPAIDIPTTSNRPISPAAGSLPLWIAGASPVKFFTIDELLKVNSTLEKMVLAHEIAVDPSFSIDKLPKDPLEEQVKKVMHDAFWKKLEEDFSKNPPDYQQVFPLIVDLKEMMMSLLNEQQVNFRELIEDGLNLPVIKQNIEKNIFDLGLLRFVIDLLGKLCAPARDEALRKIKEEQNVVNQLRGIFEFIELLKVDLANFTVSANRSTIEKYAAEYEKEQFMEVLEIDPAGNTGLKIHIKKVVKKFLNEDPEILRSQDELTGTQVKEIIVDFYMTLLESPDESPDFPETMKIDEQRIKNLSEKFLQLVLVVANIFVASNLVGRDICESTGYKAELKKDLMAVLNDVNKDNESSRIESAAIQCISKSEAICGPNRFTPELSTTMKQQILSLSNKENSIRKLARERIFSFIKDIIASGGSGPVRLPPGLSTVTQELGALTGRYLQLSTHNWRAFGVYYGELIEQEFRRLRK